MFLVALKAFRVLLGLAFALLASACAGQTPPSTQKRFENVSVTVEGKGRQILMIHGLDGASAMWRDTCARLQPARCLMIQLPGLSGSPPVTQDRYLEAMRDQMLAYIAKDAPERTTLLAHSLGGVVALMMVAKDDTAIDRVVLLDTLPFLPALFDPAKTVEEARAGASAAKGQVLKVPDEPVGTIASSLLKTAVRAQNQAEQLAQWRLAADRGTAAQALYELMTTDIRPLLPTIRRPVLVLGSWAAFASQGATKAGSTLLYMRQYAGLNDVTLKFSDEGYHFLMLDDPAWTAQEIRDFLAR